MSLPGLRDALAQNASNITHCIERARQELAASPDFFADVTRQDAALLNVQRACELGIDMANMVVSDKGWGLPDSARDAFRLLQANGQIDEALSQSLGRMVGFRNIAVHAYEKLDVGIAVHVIRHDIDALARLAGLLLNHYAQP